MKNFKAKTYVPFNFPLLEIGKELEVYLKEGRVYIGTAEVLDIQEDEYLLEFRLDREVDEDLYATVSQTASNGRASPARITLSKDKIYESFIKTIGSQENLI